MRPVECAPGQVLVWHLCITTQAQGSRGQPTATPQATQTNTNFLDGMQPDQRYGNTRAHVIFHACAS
eukprot:scaffold92877_cov18-Tisochrysis_lutea.AAC.2